MSLHLSTLAGFPSITIPTESSSLVPGLPQEFEDRKMDDTASTTSGHDEAQSSGLLNLSRDILLCLFHCLPTHQSAIQLSKTCTFMYEMYTHNRMQINRSIIPRQYPGKALDILNIFRPSSADSDILLLFEGFCDLQPPIRQSTAKSVEDGEGKQRRIWKPLAKGKETFGKQEIRTLRQQSTVIDGWVDTVYERFQNWEEYLQADDYLGNMIKRWVPASINPGWLIEEYIYNDSHQDYKECRIRETRDSMRSIIQSLIIAVSHFRAIYNVVIERVPPVPKSLRYIYFDNVLSGMDHFLGLQKGHVYDFHYLFSLSKEELLSILVVLLLLFGDQIHRERVDAIDDAETNQIALVNTNMFTIHTSYYARAPSLLHLVMYIEMALFDGCRPCAAAHFCDFVVQVRPMIHPGPDGYAYGIMQDPHTFETCTRRRIKDWDEIPVVSLVGGTDVMEGTALLIPEIASLMGELRAQMDKQMEAIVKNAEAHGVEFP